MPASKSSLPDTGPSRHGIIGMVGSLYLDRPEHLALNNLWVGLLLQSLEHTFSENERPTRFFNRVQVPGQPPVPLREAIVSLIAEGVDAVAVIALGVDPAEVDDSLAVLEKQNTPVVCVTSGALRRPVPHLFYDNHYAGYQAAEHLLRRKCKDILFLAPFMAPWVKERLAGVTAAMEHARLAPQSVLVFPEQVGQWVQEEEPQAHGYKAAQAAFEQGCVGESGRGGIVCVNDGVALGFLRAATERGLTAGKDFALVSFDDHPEARIVGLTTFRPPMDMLGKEAALLLMKAMQGEKTCLQVRLRSNLIPRSSA